MDKIDVKLDRRHIQGKTIKLPIRIDVDRSDIELLATFSVSEFDTQLIDLLNSVASGSKV